MISAAIERCAGIDVGKKFLAVCVMVGPLELHVLNLNTSATATTGTRAAQPV